MKPKIQLTLFLLFIFCSFGSAQIRGKMQVDKKEFNFSKENQYDRIVWYGEYTREVGLPELPVRHYSYVVPLDAGDVVASLQSMTKQKLDGDFIIYPVQPPIQVGEDDGQIDFIMPDKSVYESSGAFPENPVKVVSDQVVFGYRIVTIEVIPFQYIPKSNELYLCDINFSISYKPAMGKTSEISQTERITQRRYELNKRMIRRQVENPEDVDTYKVPVKKIVQSADSTLSMRSSSSGVSTNTYATTVPEYIIITHDSLKTTFSSFADWKTRKGVFTIIETIGDIERNFTGNDLPEKIRNYLISARLRWGDGLYVLLGGDIEVVPSRMVLEVANGRKLVYAADKYYATYTGTWNNNKNNVFGESSDGMTHNVGALIGRLPVSTVQEAGIIINKIITYERASTIPDLNYLKNNLYADAYIVKSYNPDVLSIFAMTELKNYTNNYVPAHINNRFICDNADLSDQTGRYSGWQTQPGGDIELNKVNFLNALNNGSGLDVGKFHIIYHMDHSGSQAMGASNKDKGEIISYKDLANLTNGTSYQILMSGGCNSANFYYDGNCEAYLFNPNGGGVAFIGNTDTGWASEYGQLRPFFNAIYSTPGYPSSGRYDIGSAFQNIKTTAGGYQSDWKLHLMGDPEMQIWTDVPKILNVTVRPLSLALGKNTITVTVANLPANEEAVICIYKRNEIYETRTVTGSGTYSFDVQVQTTNSLSVTVSAHNYLPVVKVLNVIASSEPNLYLSDILVSDQNGGNQIDAGETIGLNLRLKNNGRSIAYDIRATLECNSPYIHIRNTGSIYSNIAANATGSPMGNFYIIVDKDAPETLMNDNSLNAIVFTLNVSYNNNLGTPFTTTESFGIDVFSPELCLGRKPVYSMAVDGSIRANENVTFDIELYNEGKADALGIKTRLIPISTGYISSCSSIEYEYPDIPFKQFKTNTQRYSFRTSAAYPTGAPLNFKLEVENKYGKTWSFDFNLTEKPGTISGLDFNSGANDIELYWNPLPNVKGYNIYRSWSRFNVLLQDRFEKVNEAPVSFAYFTDIDLASGEYLYKVCAVSPNGNEGEPAYVNTYTSIDLLSPFPVTMEFARFRWGVQAVDVNYDGYKTIFASTKGIPEYIAALEYDGSEPYDIDDNVTTYSGFYKGAELPLEATPAIGDLFGDGKYYLVHPTRNEGGLQNKLMCLSMEDNDNDGKPDILWNIDTDPYNLRGYRGAILANIDNSADNSLEIIVGYENGPTEVFKADGTKILSLQVASATLGATAVADIDDDYDMEIIRAQDKGLYIWHHDGRNFGTTQPVCRITDAGYVLKASVVIADIDNDGEKEIITAAVKDGVNFEYDVKVLVYKPNGSLMSGWGSQTIPFKVGQWGGTPGIVVGDLDRDGELEIIVSTSDVVKVWDCWGNLKSTMYVDGTIQFSPVVADVDSNPDDMEIIVAASGTKSRVYAFKMDGSKAFGFPVSMNSLTYTVPCVADIDNDGKNEVITTADFGIYVWKTEGRPNGWEWGSERHDPQNTGEYKHDCPATIISGDETWTSSRYICGNLVIKSGTLRITNNSNFSMSWRSSILVLPGATLEVDGATISNANINAAAGSKVVLKNDGKIIRRSKGEVNIRHNAKLEIYKGQIY